MIKKNYKQSATTLLEILFYFTLLTIFLFAAVSFSLQISNIYGLSSNMTETQNDVNFFQKNLAYKISIAESIDTGNSVFDSDDGALSLIMSEAGKSPTRFYFSGGDVYIQEGSNTAIKLNSIGLRFDSLRFQRITYNKAPDQVIVDAQISTYEADIDSVKHSIPIHMTINLRE